MRTNRPPRDELHDLANVTGRVLPGRVGSAVVKTVTVSEEESDRQRLRAMIGGHGRFPRPGTFTQLFVDGVLMMSDVVDEIEDLRPLYYRTVRIRSALDAPRNVLINGLGLGCALAVVLAAESVERVDVVEINRDVIDLVGPYFPDDRVRVHEADAYEIRFPRGSRWDVVWHDVWPTISADNDIATLHRRYARRSGWQDSWARREVLRQRR